MRLWGSVGNLFRTQWLRGKKSTGPSAPQWHLYKLITPQLLIEPYHMRFSHNFQNHSQQILRSNLYFSYFFSLSHFFSCLWSEAVAHAKCSAYRLQPACKILKPDTFGLQEIWFYGVSYDLCSAWINCVLPCWMCLFRLSCSHSGGFYVCIRCREKCFPVSLACHCFVITFSGHRNCNPVVARSWSIFPFWGLNRFLV